jgi:microsomal dipeptidase-like Zn-dependent dipeptidase
MSVPIADLHCHYPMHLLAEEDGRHDPALKPLAKVKTRHGWQKIKATLVLLAARLLNFSSLSGTWRVNFERIGDGGVRLVFSVLYVPEAEMDFNEWPDGEPEDNYFDALATHLQEVNDDLTGRTDGDRKALVVTKAAELEDVSDDGTIRFVHCVEGGFHLGATIGKVDERVRTLAKGGVAYITLAHLFWRHVATNAPALPFLSDANYDRLFAQPDDIGLTELGEEAVRAMYKYGVMVDISHMRQRAIDETFALLAELDDREGKEATDFPAIATHAGFRFGEQSYMLSRDTIEAVAARNGVVGLIMAHHQLNDGLTEDPQNLERTMKSLHLHIEKIHEFTGSYDHIGIGSDLDGFIKPTVGGIENIDDLGQLAEQLRADYPRHASAMLHDNALRVLRVAYARRGEAGIG